MNTNKICTCGSPKTATAFVCKACRKAINDFLRFYRIYEPNYDKDKITDYIKTQGIGEVGICSICGGNFIYGGHNPYPVVEDPEASCCIRCDKNCVLPERIKKHFKAM